MHDRYPVGLSPTELMDKAGAHGIPHAFVINSGGIITYSGHPADPKFENALREAASGPQPAREKEALPVITRTYEDLMTSSAKVNGYRACSVSLLQHRNCCAGV